MEASKQQLIDRYFYEGWNKCDESVMNEILAEKFVFRGALSRKRRNRVDFIEYMCKVHTALGHNILEAEDCLISGNKAVARVKASGIHKSSFFGVEATGHEVVYQVAIFFTFNDEGTRIKEIWMIGDIDSLKNQLGASPDATVFAWASFLEQGWFLVWGEVGSIMTLRQYF